MDADFIRDAFSFVSDIRLRKMFGGIGVYSGVQIFAIEADGELFLKADAQCAELFMQSGSRPFTYEKKTGQQAVMSFWLMPERAWDDEDERRYWTEPALQAGQRA
jgi:DNA transformation protein and related proteins